MAFLNRVTSLVKNTLSKNVTSDLFAPSSSPFQAIRSFSSSKVFVGGLSYSTDEASLREEFSKYGEVTEARVITDRETGRSRGFAFVSFTDAEAASSAIQAFDGQDLHGRRVRVNYATERPQGPRGGYGGGYGGQGGYGGGGGYGGQGGYGGGGGYGGQGGYGGGNQYPRGGGGGYGGNSQYQSGGGGGYGGNSQYQSGGGSGYGGVSGFANPEFSAPQESAPASFGDNGSSGFAKTDFSAPEESAPESFGNNEPAIDVDTVDKPNDVANKSG